MFFQGFFFLKFCPYAWLVFKSGFYSRAGYNGARTVNQMALPNYSPDPRVCLNETLEGDCITFGDVIWVNVVVIF
jgi:hypothetical protein